MNWLYDEELLIQRQSNLRQQVKDTLNPKAVFLTAVFFFILIVDLAMSYEPQAVQCPTCNTLIIVIDHTTLGPEAKEIPYAGWYCDNCGKFACHGDRCVWCGCRRHKKK